jgi:L-lactate dehydrogenase complex protein LldG
MDEDARPEARAAAELPRVVAAPVSARDEILASVRAALADGAAPEPVVRAYRRGGETSGPTLVDLLHDRLVDYKAEVRRVSEAELPAAIAEVCATHYVSRLGVPPGLPDDWRPGAVTVIDDAGLSPRELDGLDGVLTACTLAIAETGTLVLAAGPEEGRRALTLVPDLHICVVRESQVVDSVPAAFAQLEPLARRPLTLVSGPSATSDIELSRVEGVHGPRTLVVLIAGQLSA